MNHDPAEFPTSPPHWERSGNDVHLVTGAGSRRLAVDDVFAVAIEGQTIDGLSPSRILNPSNIKFSRFPPRLRYLVSHDADESGVHLFLKLQALTPQGEVDVEISSDDSSSKSIFIENVWYPLPGWIVRDLSEFLNSFGIRKTGLISFGQFFEIARSQVERNFHVEIEPLPSATELSSTKTRGTPKQKKMAVFGLNASLFSYQEKGVEWLNLIFENDLGGILGDEMGLGKTLQVIAAIQAQLVISPHSQFLVVAPATLLENWKREFAKFAPNVTVMVHHGAERTGAPKGLEQVEVIVTSYDTVCRDLSLLRQVHWCGVVLDEAQAIKNPDSLRARSVKQLIRNTSLAVTGTPLENRITDLWSIMDFCLSGYLGERGHVEAMASDSGTLKLLEERIRPLLLRRRVSDVARDLPRKTIIPEVLVMGKEHAAAYEEIRQTLTSSIDPKALTFQSLTRLRLCCADPGLTENGLRTNIPDTKYCRLVELIDEIVANRAKFLIFVSYQRLADNLAIGLKERFAVPISVIDGRTSIGHRQPTVDRFSELNGPAGLIMNPRAAGVGLNITAANHVIHYTLEWNPALEDQATARAFRRGQDRPVFVHRLFYADTVEEVINDRLDVKRELAEKLIIGTQAGSNDREDIVRAITLTPTGGGREKEDI